MLRSKLRKRFLKDRTEESRCKYKKRKNVFVYLLEKAKKDYYENIDISNLSDTSKFSKLWKTKPILGSKIKSKSSITLVEGTKFIREDGELAKTINEIFVSILKIFGINENLFPVSSSDAGNVESIFERFGNHSSIVTLRNSFDENNIFSF